MGTGRCACRLMLNFLRTLGNRGGLGLQRRTLLMLPEPVFTLLVVALWLLLPYSVLVALVAHSIHQPHMPPAGSESLFSSRFQPSSLASVTSWASARAKQYTQGKKCESEREQVREREEQSEGTAADVLIGALVLIVPRARRCGK